MECGLMQYGSFIKVLNPQNAILPPMVAERGIRLKKEGVQLNMIYRQLVSIPNHLSGGDDNEWTEQ